MALTALDLFVDLDTEAACVAAIPVLEAYLEYARVLAEWRKYEAAGFTVPTAVRIRAADALQTIGSEYRGSAVSPSVSPSISASVSVSRSSSVSPSASTSPSKSASVSASVSPSVSASISASVSPSVSNSPSNSPSSS